MIGSLFSGIGGLELGLERAGLGPVSWQVEIDPFARSILEKHWPNARRFDDVCTFSAPRLELPRVSLICGGFPCQDVSVAGKGAGLEGARSGLWREFVRVVDEAQPEVVVVENVAQGLSRWLDVACDGLAALGYSPAAVVLPAGSVGAPHRRARAFVVADTNGQFLRLLEQRGPARSPDELRDGGQTVPVDDGKPGHASRPSAWAALPDVGRMGDGLSGGVDAARARTDRIRVLGNAVVPQVAEVIGRMIVASRLT